MSHPVIRQIQAYSRRMRGFARRYRVPAGPARELGRDAMRPVEMAVNASRRPDAALYRLWQQIPGGHKWWHYFDIYEDVLGALRARPIRFLEIGVYQGGSLAMWREYLHADSVIVGLDIDPGCARFEDPKRLVHVRIGDQSDTAFLAQVVQEFGPFDVILDDGSHRCSHMIKTFGHLFLSGLTPRGLYIAEDTHSNFWPEYRDQAYSFIDLCKDLVDLSHLHYLGHSGPQPYTIGNEARVQSVAVPRIGAQIEEIRFFDSVVVIRRNAARALPNCEKL